jgi:hypothetical protein
MLFFPVFVYTEPRSANQNFRRPPLFSFIGKVPTGLETTSLAPAAPRPPHIRHRDEKHVTASPLDSAPLPRAKSRGTNCDARNPFRMRCYEKCRVSVPQLPTCPARNAQKCLAQPLFFSTTCAMPLAQLFSFEDHPFSWGGVWGSWTNS